MFLRLRRRMAIRRMRRRMGRELRMRYGPKRAYTPGQIDRTYDDLGYAPTWRPYAHGMYGDERSYPACFADGGGPSVDEAREAVGRDLFGGDAHFDAYDVIDGGHGGGDGVDGGGGGGDGGGDAGGDGGGGD